MMADIVSEENAVQLSFEEKMGPKWDQWQF